MRIGDRKRADNGKTLIFSLSCTLTPKSNEEPIYIFRNANQYKKHKSQDKKSHVMGASWVKSRIVPLSTSCRPLSRTELG